MAARHGPSGQPLSRSIKAATRAETSCPRRTAAATLNGELRQDPRAGQFQSNCLIQSPSLARQVLAIRP